MDLFEALPALRRHPLLSGKQVTLIGVSAIVCDDAACYFEVGKRKNWKARDDGTTLVGLGGIGGSIKQGESVLACLRREAEEELGAQVRLELPAETYLLDEWRVVDRLSLKPSKKRPTPLMVMLTPPRLGGAGMPDRVAIVAFLTRLRGTPEPCDLFGLLRVEMGALAAFFGRDEWPLNEAQAHPGVTVTLNGPPPSNPVLRSILTAHAFQVLVRAGYACD